MSEPSRGYQVVALTEPYFSQTAEILAQYWSIPLEVSKLRLRWKYLDCPLKKTSLFYLALFEDQVVGMLGFFPSPFQLDGEPVHVVCPGDAFVSLAHRRFGIYTKLFLHGHRELASYYDYFVSLSANPISAAGLLKIGWRSLALRKEQSHFQLISSMRYLLKMDSLPLKGDVLVSDAQQIADLYEMIPSYHHVDTRNSCVPQTERNYISWRYSNPTEKYVAIPYYQQGKLHAFAVFMVTRRDAFLLDYREQVGANALKPVLDLMKKHIPIPRLFLPVFIFSSDQRKTLSRCGFHDYRPLINCFIKRPAVPILIHPVCEKPEARHWHLHGQDMRDAAHWLIPEFCNDGY